jgi:hypothetical protein
LFTSPAVMIGLLSTVPTIVGQLLGALECSFRLTLSALSNGACSQPYVPCR